MKNFTEVYSTSDNNLYSAYRNYSKAIENECHRVYDCGYADGYADGVKDSRRATIDCLKAKADDAFKEGFKTAYDLLADILTTDEDIVKEVFRVCGAKDIVYTYDAEQFFDIVNKWSGGNSQ